MTTRIRERREAMTVEVETQFSSYDRDEGRTVEETAEGKTEVVSVHTFITEPAKVEVSYGLTINTGNYNNAKVGVAVAVPCYKEEIDAAYAFATKFAEDKVEEVATEIEKASRDRAKELY